MLQQSHFVRHTLQTVKTLGLRLSVASFILGASMTAQAVPDAQYHFLPAATVVENVKSQLMAHGIDPSAITIEADAEGVVTLSGIVDSKQQASQLSQSVMQSTGVYAVISALRYNDGETQWRLPMETPALERTPISAPESVQTNDRDGANPGVSDISEPRAW